jgi:hypothetical protein
MQRSWQESGSAAYDLSKIFEVRAVLGVPWTLQFAGVLFIGMGALIVGKEGFGSDVGVEDCFAGAFVEVTRVVVVVMRGRSVWLLGTFGFGAFV